MLPPPAKGPLSNQVRQKIYDILGDLCCDLAIPCNVHFPFKDERATVLFKALTAAAVYADRYAKAKLAAIENAKAVNATRRLSPGLPARSGVPPRGFHPVTSG
jgi:hypothetical protein